MLWTTGGWIGEALALRAGDVRRDALAVPNRKNPGQPTKRPFLPTGSPGTRERVLPGELLLWQQQQHLEANDPLFYSRKKGPDGERRAISRVHAWRIVKAASARAGIRVLVLRSSQHGDAGAPAPVHPHLFRHARVRQLVRQTKSLPVAQKRAGWSRLQTAYFNIGDEEARELMRQVPE